MRARSIASIFLVTNLLAGCGDAPTGSIESASSWTAHRSVRFGDAEGPGALSSVFDVDVSSDGRVIVSEPTFGRVAVFDPDGTYSHEVGRKGQGPGEFQYPGNLGWRADTLTVLDFSSGIYLFSVDGTYHEKIGFAGPAPDGHTLPVRPILALADGTVLAMSPVGVSTAISGRVADEVWLKTARDGAVLDTVLSLPLAGRYVSITGAGPSGEAVSAGTHPIVGPPTVTAPANGAFLLTWNPVPEPDGDGGHSISVMRVDLHGDTILSAPIPLTPLPFTDAHADSISAARAPGLIRRGLTEGAATSAWRSQAEWPDYWPAVSAVLVADDGEVWLRRELAAGDSIRWDVLGSDLDRVGTVVLPAALDAKVTTGRAVYGVELDSLDVPTVVKYEIRR